MNTFQFDRVIIVGASGMVGSVFLDLLSQQRLAPETVALASSESAGRVVPFGDATLTLHALDGFSFAARDLVFFSAGGSVSAEHAPRATEAGAVVIDNTSEFRCREGIPLVVPEVNGELLDGVRRGTLIANPNCSTIQMVVALAPLHRAYGLQRVNVATYQSVSGAGREAVDALHRQLGASPADANGQPADTWQAGNVIPAIDAFEDNGYTREEMKMHRETRWILGDERIAVNATAVRVPVDIGHAEAVHAEFREPFEMEDVRELLSSAPGIRLVTGAIGRPTPRIDAAGNDDVWVGRVRRDLSHPRGLDLWVVSDNLRKGAALNAVQIATRVAARFAGIAASSKVHSA